MKLTHCTLTGVDESIPLSAIAELSIEFPLVEWGFLYSPKRQGKPGRYPSLEYLRNAFMTLPADVRIAMHVCGDGVHNLLAGMPVEGQLLDLVAARNGRIQLNFNQRRDPVDLQALNALIASYPEVSFITQHNEANESVWQSIAAAGPANHAVLFDASGGNGIVREHWPDPLAIACGYAGGLGPDNLQAELGRIGAKVGLGSTWVDMEGKLRCTDEDGFDWLDLTRCRESLQAVSRAMAAQSVAHAVAA